MLDYQIFIVSLQETNNRGHNYDLLTLVTSGSGWKPVLLVTVGKCDSICLRIMVMLLTAGWKPVPHWAMSSEQWLLIIDYFGTGFQPADWLPVIRRLRPTLYTHLSWFYTFRSIAAICLILSWMWCIQVSIVWYNLSSSRVVLLSMPSMPESR